MPAYKCQLTKKLLEGEPIKQMLVDLSEDCALLIYPQARLSPRKTDQATISPEAAEKIKAALAALLGPVKPEKKQG